MRLQNPRSAKIAVLFLIPVGAGIRYWYAWQQFAYLTQFHFGADKAVGMALCLMAAAYFCWHAFSGRPAGISEAHDSFGMGASSSILAITLTLSGPGYEHHVLKILVVTFLYLVAAFFFWWAYKGYPLSVAKHRT